MLLAWETLFRGAAGGFDGRTVSIEGWAVSAEQSVEPVPRSYFLIVPEPACCGGCLAVDPFGCLEAYAAAPVVLDEGPMRFVGRLVCLAGDRLGYAYQLREVQIERRSPAEAGPRFAIGRRQLVAGAAATVALAACAPVGQAPRAVPSPAVERLLAGAVSIDVHSHAGRVHHLHGPYRAVAEPMRVGRMATVCLAMVGDSGTHRVTAEGRIAAFREPAGGELYVRSLESFDRMKRLIASEGLATVLAAGDLRPGAANRPAAIVSAEGADFLDSDLDRVDEAYERHGLRHLQLTHYRVNTLGDIQTVAPVHGGLTDFGAQVVTRCNRLGIVVDIAHGTFDLVKRAASVTTRPLVLSHTSLVDKPLRYTRRITADHARAVADTGGVIGVWPVAAYFKDMDGYARGIARMVDLVGIDHVGIGSDQRGLVGPSVFDDYDQLPDLARALLAAGFNPDEAARILGGNYARVFAATMSPRPA